MVTSGEGDARCVQVQRALGVAGGGGEGRGGCGDGQGGVFGLNALLDLCEGLLLALAEALQFLGDAVLDLEFQGFGAGRVGLVRLVSFMFCFWVLVFFWVGCFSYLRVGLERID